jgi:predicted alpha/beta hydrolase
VIVAEGPPNNMTVALHCDDGIVLGGDLWPACGAPVGQIIINPATGVLARFYHRYARFLAGHGFEVLTYDYRGIGASRPEKLRGCGYRWRDWGLLDFEAALRFMNQRRREGALTVIGHSFGGVIPGLAPGAGAIDRMLTVGAQYAWPGDYARARRLALIAKWHVAMPLLTAACGYFPGKRLGWLEDLPAGVANEWSFRGLRFESSLPRAERSAVVSRMAAVTSPILAVAVTDDALGTLPAIQRTLDYYTGSPRSTVLLRPADYGRAAIGHFDLFRDTHAAGFWTDTLLWLTRGINPWPERLIAPCST